MLSRSSVPSRLSTRADGPPEDSAPHVSFPKYLTASPAKPWTPCARSARSTARPSGQRMPTEKTSGHSMPATTSASGGSSSTTICWQRSCCLARWWAWTGRTGRRRCYQTNRSGSTPTRSIQGNPQFASWVRDSPPPVRRRALLNSPPSSQRPWQDSQTSTTKASPGQSGPLHLTGMSRTVSQRGQSNRRARSAGRITRAVDCLGGLRRTWCVHRRSSSAPCSHSPEQFSQR